MARVAVSREVRLTAAAEADLRAAVEWYRAEADHLSSSFRLRFEEAVDRLRERPLAYPTVVPGIRRALVRRFPYSLFFRQVGRDAVIIAIVHQARDPRLWQRRLR